MSPREPDLFYAAGFQDQTLAIVPSRAAVIVRLRLANDTDDADREAFLADILAALHPQE